MQLLFAQILLAADESSSAAAGTEMINIPTFVFQLINFAILVLLLRYFLYGRIVDAMQKREESIAAEWDKAEQEQSDAQKLKQSYEEKMAEIDAEREELLEKSRNEAEELRKKLTAKVQEEISEQRTRWRQSLNEERDAFLNDLRRQIAAGALTIAREALKKMADSELEDRVCHVFIHRLQHMDHKHRQELLQEAKNADNRITVRSSLELNETQRQSIEQAIKNGEGSELVVDFAKGDNLLCGLEIQTDSHKISWDLGEYVANLQEKIAKELRQTSNGNDTSSMPSQENS